MQPTRSNPFGLASVAGVLVLFGLGAWAIPASAQLDPGTEDIVCGNTDFPREIAASPDLVADIEGLADLFRAVYGGSIEKNQAFFQDDAALVAETCTALLGNAHVVRDLKGDYVLVDEDEIFLGNWRPGVLSAEVTRDGFAFACHFADVGSSGDKVLYTPLGMGLFLPEDGLSYLADFELNNVYVAIDLDGNQIGGPISSPPGEGGDDDDDDDNNLPGTTMTRSECITRGGSTGAGPRFAACFDTTNGQPSHQECRDCCNELVDACKPHTDNSTASAIMANIRDCFNGCRGFPVASQATLPTP